MESVVCRGCGKTFEPSYINKEEYCSKCTEIEVWKIMIGMYKQAYAGDNYRQTVFENIERIILRDKLRVVPRDFERMLTDRGISITDKNRMIWNMTVDEVRSFDIIMLRWHENSTVNKVFEFLGKL